MQLNTFNGGLNVQLGSHLIGQNEGVIYSNIDSAIGSISPLPADTNLSIAGGNTIVYFNGSWITSSEQRHYVEFQNKLCYSNGVDRPKKSTDGINWNYLGIEAPTNSINTISVATPGNLNGTYQWCYTYYNSNDGTESMPSEYSTELLVSNGKATINLVASTDPQVTNIRVYRIGGNLLYMTMVEEIDNITQNYEDNIADIDVTNVSLSSTNAGPAPLGLSYLTEFNTMLFGSVGPKLWFTDVAYPNSWGPYNYIELESTITAIGVTVNGLLVFTNSRIYVITGNEPGGLSKYLLSTYQGCKSHRSIQFLKGACIFVSNDGICVADGTNVKVVSLDKLGKVSLNPVDSAIYNDEYYLLLNDKTILVDFKLSTPIVKYLDITGQCIYYSHDLDTLYYSKDNIIYSCFTSTNNRSLLFKSGRIADGALTNRKNYNNIYIYATGDMQCKIYIDSILCGTYQLTNGVNDIAVPVALRYGYYVEFEFSGTNSILEVEFKVEGRQNGR